MSIAKVVGARDTDGDVTWHARASMPANYHTLCSMSLDDVEFDPVTAPRGQRIDCKHCKAVFLQARRFRVSDFPTEL